MLYHGCFAPLLSGYYFIFSTTCFLAVVDALKTLQHKIRRLEGERMQAQKSYQQISQNVQPAASQPETENCSRKGKREMKKTRQGKTIFKDFFSLECFLSVVCVLITELDSKLQSAEARCKILEKQLDYMKKMVESVKKERIILTENQVVQEKINMEKCF